MLVASSNFLSIVCSTFRLGSLSVGPVRDALALVLCVNGGGGGLILLEALELLAKLKEGDGEAGVGLLLSLRIIPGN
jgi:hypothetical protein